MAARYRVDIAASAVRDIGAIAEHIAADDPAAARKWTRAVARVVRSLDRFPFRNPVIPEATLLGVPYRHVILGSYRLLYRMEEERVLILRVVHGAQLLRLPPGEPPAR